MTVIWVTIWIQEVFNGIFVTVGYGQLQECCGISRLDGGCGLRMRLVITSAKGCFTQHLSVCLLATSHKSCRSVDLHENFTHLNKEVTFS